MSYSFAIRMVTFALAKLCPDRIVGLFQKA
jgi:hypothetical protein